MPIHLQIRKLVEGSHSRARQLAERHAFRGLVDGDHPDSMLNLPVGVLGGLRTSVTEAWANLDLCTQDLRPFHDFNQPGLRSSLIGSLSMPHLPLLERRS